MNVLCVIRNLNLRNKLIVTQHGCFPDRCEIFFGLHSSCCYLKYFYLFIVCPDVKMSPVLFGVILANAVVMLESDLFISFLKFFKYDLILVSFSLCV